MSCRVLMGRTGAGRPSPTSLERGKEHTGYYREKGGGGSRNSRMVTVGAIKGDQVRLEASPRTTTDATGTIEVYPIPSD